MIFPPARACPLSNPQKLVTASWVDGRRLRNGGVDQLMLGFSQQLINSICGTGPVHANVSRRYLARSGSGEPSLPPSLTYRTRRRLL